jgi:eukaryotic-like serine/threonine-protein kinase
VVDEGQTADATPDPPVEDSGPSYARMKSGQRLGRYELIAPLAQGGMGVVYAARLVGAHGVDRLVALKTLRPITSISERAALLAEARLTSKLHHRNVVATLELGELDDIPYVVMELVDGVSLARLLSQTTASGERLPPHLAAWIVLQVGQGLHAAHELKNEKGKLLGLVHRDVSPQNVLLSVDGEVKIADFGIAKYAGREESTATGMIKGKFAYMSPEQASSQDLDRQSDVFALGVVLYEALTGVKLFASDTPAKTILRVLEHKPKPPHDVRPEVSESLSKIAMRCIEKEKEKRYGTAADVVDALRAALRESGAHVDEGDLAAIVKKLFGEERRRAMEALTSNEDDPTHSLETTPKPPPAEASGLAPVSLSSDPSAARTSRNRILLTVIGVAAIGAIALGVKLSSSSTPPPEPAKTPAASNVPPPPPPTSEPAATISVAAPTPSASPSPSPSPPATAASPIAKVGPRPKAPLTATSASAAKPTPSAPVRDYPKPTNSAGVPFESL